MTIHKAQGIELHYEDPGANSFKFYRVIWVGKVWVAQWGRIGATGQFKVNVANDERTAMVQGGRQQMEKINKGYRQTGRVVEYDVSGPLYEDLNQRFSPGVQRDAAETLAGQFLTACATSGAMEPEDLEMIQTAQEAVSDRQAKQDAKMKNNLLKMAAKLRTPSPEVAAAAPPSPGNMEARLAAALERAENRTEGS